MKIYEDKPLTEFNFWSGAIYNRNLFTDEEMEQIESILDSDYPEGITDTELNDIFWFEDKWLCEVLGIDYENDYLKRECEE